MKRNQGNNPAASKVTTSASAGTLESASVWQKREKPSTHPAPPQIWSRYIDSRLKQFVSR